MPRAIEVLMGIVLIGFLLYTIWSVLKDYFEVKITTKEILRDFKTFTPLTEREVEEMILSLNEKIANSEKEAKEGVFFAEQQSLFFKDELQRIQKIKEKFINKQ